LSRRLESKVKIRTKILLGFLILAVMLAVAGAYSIYELTSISTSVQKLLDDNYRSINAAKQMVEALEREDSGILLLLSGKWKEGRATIVDAHRNFGKAFDIASHNVTVPGEKDIVDKIYAQYQAYRNNWEKPIVGTEYEGNLSWYFEKVHQDFTEVKGAVENLMTLNDDAIYQTASTLKNRAHRAVMPGIVAILTALVFSIIFNFFVNLYVVNPILSIIKAIKNFLQSGKPIKLEIDTSDELHELAASIVNLTAMIHSSK
jgi:methyl-accepting chemotaxis protein